MTPGHSQLGRGWQDDKPLTGQGIGFCMARDEVVENGAAFDPVRLERTEPRSAAMEAATDRRVNLKGFYYQSSLDNYRLTLGRERRFGLVHVDFHPQKHTARVSCHALTRTLAP